MLAAARSGRSGVLVLRGEAGVGKTSLLGYAAGSASGLRVHTVRGLESEHTLPFAGLSQLVAPWTGHTGRLPPVQATALRGALALGPPVESDRFAICAATLGILAAAAEEQPLLLCVDDYQWLDVPSAEALLFAASRLDAEGIAALVATRDPGALAGFDTLELAGLDESAALQLLGARAPTPPAEAVARRLCRETAGNPLALIELAGALSRDQLLGRASIDDPLPSGRTVQALFSHRLAGLDEAARAALLLAALAAGDDLACLSRAAELCGIPAAALERLEGGLVSFAAGTVAFTHPLLRSLAVTEASAPARRAAHKALARAMDDPRHSDRRAWHLARSVAGPDEEAAAALEDVARRARRRSGYAAAAAAYARAADLSPEPAERARRRCAAADAAGLAGDREQALRLLRDAAGDPVDPLTRVAIGRITARLALLAGRPAEAQTLLTRAADELAAYDPATAARLRVDAALAALLAGDLGTATRLALADDGGDRPALEPLRRLVAGACLLRTGRTAEGLGMLEATARLTERDVRQLEARHLVFAALGLGWVGSTATARTLLHPVIGELRAGGALALLPHALYAAAFVEDRAGRFAAARAHAAEAADLAHATGMPLWRYQGLGCLALVEAHLGDEQPCRRHAAQALELRDRLQVAYPRDAEDALGALELSLGNPDLALAHLESANRPTGGPGAPTLGRPSGPDLVEASVHSGRALPDALVQQLDDQSRRAELPAHAAAAWRCRGLLAGDAEADRCFGRAVELYERTELVYDRARTLLSWGEHLRRAGRRVQARTRLRAALTVFDRIGARAWAARAGGELRATGQTLRAQAADEPARLTPQELQVTLTVAAGATNQEAAAALFLSPRTVEAHLTRVYRKLGLRSRSQLVAWVDRHLPAGAP